MDLLILFDKEAVTALSGDCPSPWTAYFFFIWGVPIERGHKVLFDFHHCNQLSCLGLEFALLQVSFHLTLASSRRLDAVVLGLESC